MPAQTHAPLTADDRQTALALQGMLVDLVDLALIGTQARWNVTGKQSLAVHQLLDELVDTWRTMADDVAARAVMLGAAPNGQVEAVAGATQLDPLPTGRLDDKALETIGKRVIDAAGRARDRIDAVDEDPVTRKLLIEIADLLVKHRCRLQAQRAAR